MPDSMAGVQGKIIVYIQNSITLEIMAVDQEKIN